jgi:hypothetical protein
VRMDLYNTVTYKLSVNTRPLQCMTRKCAIAGFSVFPDKFFFFKTRFCVPSLSILYLFCSMRVAVGVSHWRHDTTRTPFIAVVCGACLAWPYARFGMAVIFFVASSRRGRCGRCCDEQASANRHFLCLYQRPCIQ